MFILAHLGIGAKIASPWSRGLPLRWLLLGTLLPDLIDKPLYYGLAALTGKHAAELGLISGTRTFGHTGLLVLFVLALAATRRSRLLAALSLGMATHLLLDCAGEYFIHLTGPDPQHALSGITTVHAMLWPLLGWQFPTFPYKNAVEHLGSVARFPVLLGGELAGAGLLGWELWKNRHRAEIVTFIYERRLAVKRLRRRRRSPAPKA